VRYAAKSNAALEDLNTARIDAEKVRVDAQAQSDADQIARCGATSAQVERVVNGQKVQETRVTPVPADKCQNRLNEQVLTSKYIDMLRGRGQGQHRVRRAAGRQQPAAAAREVRRLSR
jgi:hypothetical protein